MCLRNVTLVLLISFPCIPDPTGIGKDHAKWQPVATVVMQYLPEITINQDLMATLTGKDVVFVYELNQGLFPTTGEIQNQAFCVADQQKEELVAADPRKTFTFNQITKQVGASSPWHATNLI